MPLKHGGGQKAAQENIEDVMHAWQKTGKIGTSHPKTKKAAQKQAVAIGLKAAGVSRSQQAPEHETISAKGSSAAKGKTPAKSHAKKAGA